MNLALDNFDDVAGNLAARKQYDTDLRYARWATIVSNNRQANDVWQARVLATAPTRLNGREVEYTQRTAALNTAYNALYESIMGKKDYWRDTRLKEFEYSQKNLATTFMIRGASVADVARMDKLFDFYQTLDTDRTNYRFGYNIDLSAYVPGATAGTNPNHIKNQMLADFSAQEFVQIARLISVQNTYINKLDQAKTEIFNQGFNVLMDLHNQMQQRLLSNLSSSITLTDPQYIVLRDRFDAYQASLVTLLTTGSWQAPAGGLSL
jgi:hypothetical protein